VNGAIGYESFRHLGVTLRGERVFSDKGFYEGLIYDAGIGGECFGSAQHDGSLGPARLVAKGVDLGSRQRVLDIGGGSGACSFAFCAANSQLTADDFGLSADYDTVEHYFRTANFRLMDRVGRNAEQVVAADCVLFGRSVDHR
jgi:2-hydroxy-4-(methylsulfanyl)butanoate S-methyltransferase